MLIWYWNIILSIFLFLNIHIFYGLMVRRPLAIKFGILLLPITSFACFINILLLLSQEYEIKFILYTICVLLDIAILTLFSIMITEFTKRWDLSKPKKYVPMLIVPGVVAFSVISDPWLHTFNHAFTLSISQTTGDPIIMTIPSLFYSIWDVYSWFITIIFGSTLILEIYKKYSKRMSLMALGAVIIILWISLTWTPFAVQSGIYFNNLSYSMITSSVFLFSFRYGIFDKASAGRQKMLDVIRDKYLIVDSHSEVIDINQSCQVYLDRPLNEIFGQKLSVVIPLLPDIDPFLVPDRTLSFPSEITDQSGSSFDVEVEEFKYNRYAEAAYIVSLHDVTEKKRAEAILREAETQRMIAESERRYRTVVDNQTEAIISFTPNGDITFLNKVMEKYLGMPINPLIRINIIDFVPMEERNHLEEQIVLLTPSDPVGEFEMETSNQDGRPLDILWRLKGIFQDCELKEVQAVGIDITERRQYQRELDKNQRLESIGILAGGIAHDFNNMLASIVGNMEIVKHDLPKDGRLRERLEESIQSAMMARRLTHQLLTFSKGGEPIKETVNLSSFIQSSVNFTLAGSNVQAIFDLEGGVPSLFVDKTQLEQVLNNLVINAVQAMPQGGHIHITTRNLFVDKSFQLPIREGKCVRLDIRDEGSGIPENIKDHIFDPFFTTKKTGGGLGLYSVQSIVRHHGGTILVDSTPGKGTTMSVILPVVEGNVQEPLPSSQSAERHFSGRIMVMDDEEFIRDMMASILEGLGFEPTCVVDGEEAISEYRAAMSTGRPFSAVIMDLTIRGGMGGKEAIQGILADDPGARVIVSSGYSDDPIMAHPNDYGFREVLPKPFTLQDLSTKLSDILSS